MSNRKEIKPTDSRKSRGSAKPDVLMPVPDTLAAMPEGYSTLLAGIKERITHERIKAVLSANAAMVLMYWDIGRSILERQHQQGWGAKVIDRLSHDLKNAFPGTTGFSPRNLKYMRTFADAWPDRAIVQRTVAQLPWRSNLTLLDKLSYPISQKPSHQLSWSHIRDLLNIYRVDKRSASTGIIHRAGWDKSFGLRAGWQQ